MVAAYALRHLWPKRANCYITLNYLLLCVVLSVPYTFRNLDCEPEEKVPCGCHSHQYKDNIEMYFKLSLQYVDCISLALSGDQ